VPNSESNEYEQPVHRAHVELDLLLIAVERYLRERGFVIDDVFVEGVSLRRIVNSTRSFFF
jgi:hypothetical protein